MNVIRVFLRIVGPLTLGLLSMWIWAGVGVFVYGGGLLIPVPTYTVAFFVGVLVAVAIIVLRSFSRSKRAAQVASDAVRESAHRAEWQAAQQIQEEQRRLERLRDEVTRGRENAVAVAKRGVDLFQLLPEKLEEAARSYARAKVALGDGAFSPFWAAIEAAYGELAVYLRTADEIGDSSRDFTSAIETLVSCGDALVMEFGKFPVVMDIEQVERKHSELLTELDSIVYEAQKDPTFALIWEQRRTTSAIETGFLNLEDAINRIGRGIGASIARLQQSLSESNAEIARSIDRLNVANTTSAEQQMLATREMVLVASEQTSTMRELNSRAEAIREHLYYPDISRWLR